MSENYNDCVCVHFKEYYEKFDINSYKLVHGCFSTSVSVKTRKLKALQCYCYVCGSTSKLYSCLECIFFACKGEHLNEHFQSMHHSIGLELAHGMLYCHPCKDFIYFEKCKQIKRSHLHKEAM